MEKAVLLIFLTTTGLQTSCKHSLNIDSQSEVYEKKKKKKKKKKQNQEGSNDIASFSMQFGSNSRCLTSFPKITEDWFSKTSSPVKFKDICSYEKTGFFSGHYKYAFSINDHMHSGTAPTPGQCYQSIKSTLNIALVSSQLQVGLLCEGRYQSEFSLENRNVSQETRLPFAPLEMKDTYVSPLNGVKTCANATQKTLANMLLPLDVNISWVERCNINHSIWRNDGELNYIFEIEGHEYRNINPYSGNFYACLQSYRRSLNKAFMENNIPVQIEKMCEPVQGGTRTYKTVITPR